MTVNPERLGVPSDSGDPPPKWAMRTYVLGLIYRGPTRIADEQAADELQRAHLANNARLYKEGKLILAGPFRGDGDMRGLFLLDCETVEEAKTLCDSDPAIQAGTLRIEFHPWYSSKGIGIVQEPGVAT